jgi:hypothetical protein
MLNSAVSSVQHQIAHIEEHVLPRMCYKLKNKSLYVFTNYLFYYLLGINYYKTKNPELFPNYLFDARHLLYIISHEKPTYSTKHVDRYKAYTISTIVQQMVVNLQLSE